MTSKSKEELLLKCFEDENEKTKESYDQQTTMMISV